LNKSPKNDVHVQGFTSSTPKLLETHLAHSNTKQGCEKKIKEVSLLRKFQSSKSKSVEWIISSDMIHEFLCTFISGSIVAVYCLKAKIGIIYLNLDY